MLRTILVPLDLTRASSRVLERALRLPLAEDVRVTLVHAVPSLLPSEARARAEADARALLEEHAARVAPALPERAVVRTVVAIGSASAAIREHAEQDGTELIVMGRGGHGALRDVVFGATAERVLRRARRPVLVVRLPADAPYQRPMLALDVGQPLHELLGLTLRILPPPRPVLEWVHAYEAPFEGLVYPSFTNDEARQYRHHYRQQALHDVAAHLEAARERLGLAPDAVTFRSHVSHGPARTVVQDTVLRTGADLLALGTHGYSAVTRAFLGTVAGDVLREVPCDVLVVPPREEAGEPG